MLSFNVERNSTYLSFIIDHENGQINSGLLDEAESVDLAKELIYAAEQLLPAGYGENEHNLSIIREKL